MTKEKYTISKRFTFEASHIIPGHQGKCSRLHGHSWTAIITITSNQLDSLGMVDDFAAVSKVWKPLSEKYLDHWHLNDTLKMESPTCENVAKWIHIEFFKAACLSLNISTASQIKVTVHETASGSATYEVE